MIEQCFGGIDVSQDRLDVLLLPQGTGFSVDNDEAGWSTLIGRLRGQPVAAIGLEPSGGYERGVLRALLAAGLSVRRINPNRLRQFARARGALAKNDRLDARPHEAAPAATLSREPNIVGSRCLSASSARRPGAERTVKVDAATKTAVRAIPREARKSVLEIVDSSHGDGIERHSQPFGSALGCLQRRTRGRRIRTEEHPATALRAERHPLRPPKLWQ